MTRRKVFALRANRRCANIGLMKVLMDEMVKHPLAIVLPIALFVAAVVGGVILRHVLFRALRGWAARTDSHLDVLLTQTLRGPILIWSVLLGIHMATRVSDIPAEYKGYIHPAIEVLWVWWITVTVSRFAGSAVRYYGAKVTGVQSVTSLTQKLVQILVIAIGLVWVLKVVFDMNLTPLLTAFGVGGLAVALALQDTLSNLFAGFYVSISGLVRIGDYIKLNTGEEGFVADIAWRCTTMRTITNNLVVIPNNKLGQSIFTNYYLPEPRMLMWVTFSVGYDSDIDRVEEILLEETIAAAAVIDGLLKDPPPAIRFNPGPGDWALGFQVNFHVAQFADQYKVQSALRKLLYKRLVKEKISMPFPTRTVLLEDNRAHGE
jgi:small-conductance mechanosensitive channel